MGSGLLNKYIWLVDTIRRYGRISRRELDRLWSLSPFSQGEGLPRRTLYDYRNAVEELFNIEIKCDPSTYEYYIDEGSDPHGEGLANWLFNSAALNDMLSGSRSVADRIFLEDVPSAREHLADVIGAIRDRHPVRFDYNPYTRSTPTRDVVLRPYLVKIFRQRWYVAGLETASGRIKTYALDRIGPLAVLPETFDDDPDFDPEEYFRHSFGIVVTHGKVRTVRLRADARQAKYLRALPLHHSQSESVHDDYSIFTYSMRLSDDLVEELLSHGAAIEVLEPPELRAMVRDRLEKALEHYANG